MSDETGQEITKWTLRTRLLVSLIIVPVGFVLWIAFGFNHAIANGGEIYQEVTAVRDAVPIGATNIRVETSSASWIDGCSSEPGSRSGWTTDRISITFDDRRTRQSVLEALARSLHSQGWRRHDAAPGSHQGKIPHWTLNVKSVHLAQAWAFPVGPGDQHWYLSGSWRPPGPVGQGCP